MADEIKIPIANENTLQEVKNKLIEMDAKLGNDTLVFTVIDVNRQMSWKDEAAVNINTYSASAAVVNGNEIYILSGVDFNSYNVETKVWESKKAAPQAANYVALSYLDGKVYVMGTAINSVLNQEYDVVNNTWSVKADIPISTKFASSVVYENSIFLICSDNNAPNNTKTVICKYIPSTNIWSVEAELSQSLGGIPKVGIYGSKIFIFNQQTTVGYSYDIKAKIFESIETLGVNFGVAISTYIDNQMYISSQSTGTYFYDMKRNEWVKRADNPYNTTTTACACKVDNGLRDKLFFITRYNTTTNQVLSYDHRPVLLAPCKKDDVFYTIGDGVMAGSQELLANEMTVILEDGFIETDREFTFGWLKIGGLNIILAKLKTKFHKKILQGKFL